MPGFSGNVIHQSIIQGLAQGLSFADSIPDSESPLNDVLHTPKKKRSLEGPAWWPFSIGRWVL